MFDVTRQIEKKDWFLNEGKWLKIQDPRPIFDQGDLPNDDNGSEFTNGDTDEDNIPNNDYIYSVDVPGFRSDGRFKELVYRANFKEFVRVSFDGIRPTFNVLKGSRCSGKINWHSFLWVEANGTSYIKKAGELSSVGEGHLPLGPDDKP